MSIAQKKEIDELRARVEALEKLVQSLLDKTPRPTLKLKNAQAN